MSVAAEPRSHAPYAEPDEYIDYQLRKTQTGIKRIDMLTAAIVAITVLIGYVLLFVLSDHWLFEGGVGSTARVLMFLPMIGFVGWLIGAKVIWPALRNVSGLYAARTLEASSTEFRSGLLNLVDLKQAGREVSPLILATMEKRAAVTLAKFNVDDAIDKRPLLRTLYVLFGIVVVFCAYSIFSPKKLGPSVLRAIVPFTNVTPATQTEILEVKPGDAKLRAGGILPVSVQLRGEVPADVTLLFTTDDRRFVDEPVQLGATTDPKLFEGTLGNDEHGLLQSFSYHVVAGDARSPEYRVEIITPPSATVTEVRYDYPEYTELDPRTQMGGAIDVWERTGVTITAATNVPIKSAEFELSDTEDFSAAYPGPLVKIADGKKLTISWRADPRQADGKFPKFYRIKVKDAEGTPDPKPAVYPINVRIDQPPQVVLIDPTTNLELPANGTVPLVVAARDPDFKLRTISLKIARDEDDVTDESLFDGSQQEVALKHDFQLEPLRLKSGDKIRIWVEAQDNRLPTHNLAKTPPIEITITGKVTKEEAKKQLDGQKKEQQQRLDEAAKNNDQPNDPTPSDPANSPDQLPRDPNEPEQPKDKEDEANKDQPQQNGQKQQDDKNSKGQNGGSGKTQKSGEGKKSETGREEKSDKPGEKGNTSDGTSRKTSLKDDGTQDQEALEKIARDAKQRGELRKKSEPQENSTGEPSDKPMPNGSSKPNPQDDPKANDSSKPPQPNRGQQPKSDTNDGNDPKTADGSKEPKGKSPKEGDEPKSEDKSSAKPEGPVKEPNASDPKSSNKPDGKEGDDKDADGGNKPMPKKGPGEKNEPSTAEDKAGEKTGNKPDAQKPATNDKSGNDQKPSQPDGSGKPDSQKPKGLGKPETDDKQRSPDGAKTDKPSNDDKSANPKEGDAGSDKPDSKKPNDPSGKGNDDKDSKSPDKQSGSDKSEDSKPGDKGAEKTDSSKKPRRGQPGDKSKDPSNDKGDDNKSPSDKPGDDKPGQPKDGNKGDSGQSKKEGSPKSDKGGQKSGGKEGQPKSASKEGSGEPSDSDSDSKGPAKPGSQGSKKGKAGSAPGSGSASQPGDPSASNNPSSSGSSSGTPEEANEEFTKEAANLVLKRLQKEIERGEVDQELLDELGWNEEQMRKFVERMQQQLEDKPGDDSPQTKARRRQFEEMLKNLNITEKTQRRDDTNKDKQTGDGIGPVRRPPPPEYRESFESYTKSLSKKKATETPKK